MSQHRRSDHAAEAAHDAALALSAEIESEKGRAADFPSGLVANVRDVGGEVSATVDETNRRAAQRRALRSNPMRGLNAPPPRRAGFARRSD